MKDSFSKLHPSILIFYFLCQILLTALCFHPVTLLISFCAAFLYIGFCISYKRAFLWGVAAVIYIICFGLINPLINHQGETVLFYFMHREITLQSICFGVLTGVMLSSVCMWLYIMSKTLNSQKWAYLFKGGLPTITLMLFITARLLRRYAVKYKEIAEARMGMFPNEKPFKRTFHTLETLLTFALENGVDTADAMTAKGYGLSKPTAYYSYPITIKDIVAALTLLSAFILTCYGIATGVCKMYFFPGFFVETQNNAVFAAYLLLCIYPLITYFWSNIKWTLIK